MQYIRNSVHRLVRSLGWEVQRVSTQAKWRQIDAEQKQLEQWRFITRYCPNTVLDIGANEGQFATLTRKLLPGVQIHSFEPLKCCLDVLHNAAGSLQPIDIHPFALGSKSGSTIIHRNGFSPSSSLLAMEELHFSELPHTAQTTVEQIEVRRLDDLKLQLKGPLFIKIDVQGFEMEVLNGALRTIKEAAAIVLEISLFPLYSGAPSFDELYRFLTSECGLVYRGNIDQWVSPRDRRILQIDCLFEKP